MFSEMRSRPAATWLTGVTAGCLLTACGGLASGNPVGAVREGPQDSAPGAKRGPGAEAGLVDAGSPTDAPITDGSLALGWSDAPSFPVVGEDAVAQVVSQAELQLGDAGFPQWWYPACASSNGMCTDPNCGPIFLEVARAKCGPFTQVRAGCVPTNLTFGVEPDCLVRLSDGLIIQGSPAATLAGLSDCYPGLMPGQWVLPTCSDF